MLTFVLLKCFDIADNDDHKFTKLEGDEAWINIRYCENCQYYDFLGKLLPLKLLSPWRPMTFLIHETIC